MTMKLLDDSQYSNRPPENNEVHWWREWLCKIIFGLWYEKKEVLENIGFPARPVSQKEIFKEVQRRTEMLKQEDIWGRTVDYPYRIEHNHNWIERRNNELATNEFGLKKDGVLMIVCTDKRRGLYAPNPKLFTKRC